jgi:hypothetical protein
MSRPGIEPGPPVWKASTLEKSHSNSLLIAIRNINSTYERATSIECPRQLTQEPRPKFAAEKVKNGS